jgi:hypothetical protein
MRTSLRRASSKLHLPDDAVTLPLNNLDMGEQVNNLILLCFELVEEHDLVLVRCRVEILAKISFMMLSAFGFVSLSLARGARRRSALGELDASLKISSKQSSILSLFQTALTPWQRRCCCPGHSLIPLLWRTSLHTRTSWSSTRRARRLSIRNTTTLSPHGPPHLTH